MSASPFGFGASMAPEDLARLFGRTPLGAPQSFAPIAENEADVQRLEQATGMVPKAVGPMPRAGLVDVSPSPRPGAMTVPLPPSRPAEFSTAEADAPAPGAQPIMAAPAAPASAPAAAPDGPSFGDTLRKGLRDNGDYLGALGAGLLSSPTWHGGVAAAMQLASKTEKDRAVTDLAKAEYGLKARKLAQETGALSGNAALLKRAYPGLSDQEAMAQASNSSALTEALKIVRDPNHGRENDPAIIRQRAQAQAEGSAAGKPDKAKWRQVQTPDGGTMLYNEDDPTQNQMLVQGQPVRPATEEELQRFGIAPGQGVKMTAKDGPVAIGTPPRPQAQTFERADGTKETRVLNSRTGQWEAPDLDGGASASAAGNPYATGKFNNEQGKAAGFSDRMLGSEQTLRGLEGINSGFGGGLAGTMSGWTPNGMKSADRQRFEQAKRDFVNAQLRRESGAAISQKEFDNADAQYFPQPGDSADVITQKRTNRQRAVEAMAREGGPSYRPHSVFDQSGAIVPYQPGGTPSPAPRQPATPAKRLRFDPATGALN
ncbi:hypothetical protein [Methylorubrum sp. DB1722]|uniref:hypothetical protein n=1 Tax=Methylorubrum sp. DB1722 TaxID=2478916 RepID=UPI0018E3DFBF|nr:hypothetical protein [Methylorubrum sp. DB1722]